MILRFAVMGVALWAGTGFAQVAGQPVERVLTFRYADTPTFWQEIYNAVRSIADIQEAVLDRSAKTVTMRGSADHIATAEWTFQELDRMAQPTAPNVHEFAPKDMGDAVVCVYSFSHINTPVAMQESVNAVRSVTDILRLFPINGISSVVMRGTASQVAMAKWVLQQLDSESPAAGKPAVREYRPTDMGDAVTRVFFLANTHTPQALQEMVNATRSVADVQRFFPVNFTWSIVMRGTAAQAELCQWLVERLDAPGAPMAGEYMATEGANPVVRLFVPANAANPQALQELVARVRSETKAQRVFAVSSKMAVTFRGTAAQAGAAAALMQ